MTPNRVVATLVALLGLGAAVAVPLANTDWTSTTGIIVGLGVVFGVAYKWLDGWQKYEERQSWQAVRDQPAPTIPPPPPYEGDMKIPVDRFDETSGKRDPAEDANFDYLTAAERTTVAASEDLGEDTNPPIADPTALRPDLHDLDLPSEAPYLAVVGHSDMKDSTR